MTTVKPKKTKDKVTAKKAASRKKIPSPAHCLDYMGRHQLIKDCVVLTVGKRFAGEYMVKSSPTLCSHGEDYWRARDDISEKYVRCFPCNSLIKAEEAVTANAGSAKGRYIYKLDAVTHEGLVWHTSYMPDFLVHDLRNQIQLLKKCRIITDGRSSSRYALRNLLTKSDYDRRYWMTSQPTPSSILQDFEGKTFVNRNAVTFKGSVYHKDHLPEGLAVTPFHGYHSAERDYTPRTTGKLPFCIGFEVEKYSIDSKRCCNDLVEKQPIFSGWELDGSCGVEGISYVYGLDNYARFAKDVDNSSYVNAESSSNCGGHVNLSGPGVTLKNMRKYMGLIMALWPERLRIGTCGADPRFESGGHKSCAITVKLKRVEIRMVGPVLTGDDLKFRFRLFRQLCMAIQNGLEFRQFMRRCGYLLREYFPDAKDRLRIRESAFKFQKFIDTGEKDAHIESFVHWHNS